METNTQEFTTIKTVTKTQVFGDLIIELSNFGLDIYKTGVDKEHICFINSLGVEELKKFLD